MGIGQVMAERTLVALVLNDDAGTDIAAPALVRAPERSLCHPGIVAFDRRLKPGGYAPPRLS
jgi:hypothetical protein